jgi:hypothetical protein
MLLGLGIAALEVDEEMAKNYRSCKNALGNKKP